MEPARRAKAPNLADTARRKFLASVGAIGAASLLALGAGIVARDARALPAQAVRPPGALPEQKFLGACVRCGQCVRACPYNTLKLADVGSGVGVGTPYFTARMIPCEMCEDIPCVKACPTNALDHGLTDIAKARMGLAVLVDDERCLNALGMRCEACYRACPLRGKAITLERRHNVRTGKHAMFILTVHSGACTGCGKCEKSCVLDDEAAIKVLPVALAKSGLGTAPWAEEGRREQRAGAPRSGDASHCESTLAADTRPGHRAVGRGGG